MVVACPCCKATNSMGPTCRRCKADLGELFQVATAAEAAYACGRHLLTQGDIEQAIASIDSGLELRVTPEGMRLRALSAYLGRDFATALAWHRMWETACAKSS